MFPPFYRNSGTLPDTICQARSLNVISLDGLTSSTACVQYMWDPLHFFNSGYFAKSMRGTPALCLLLLLTLPDSSSSCSL